MGLFSTKPIDRILQESEGSHGLRRSLTGTQLVALGIGAIIGAGLFSLTGIAAAENAGPGVVLSFVLAAVACGLAGFCYSEFATLIPVAGSAYTYAYATMGELLAWIIGWDLVLEYAVGSATVAVSWSRYVVSFFADLGITIPHVIASSPWETVTLADGTQAAGGVNILAAVIVALASYLLIIGIQESARANTIIVILKVSVVLVFIAIGSAFIDAENYVPFVPENTGNFGEFGFSGVVRGAGVIFFAYIGFDAVSTAAQEAKNPQKDMPIGIIGSLVVCTLLYVAFSFVLTGMVNYKDLSDAAPVALAIDKTPFPWLRVAIKVAIIAGYTSVILVLLLGQSRVFYSMSRDGLLPRIFSDVHPRFGTPWRSNLLFLVVVSLLASLTPISHLGHMTSIGTLFAFAIVCGAVLVLRRTQPDLKRPFRTPWVPVVPIAGILCNVYLMYGLGWETWTRLAVWLAIGLAVYFAWGRRHSRLSQLEASPDQGA